MGSSNAYWFVTNHIVFVHNVGDLTADDFRNVDRQITSFMREAHANGYDQIHVLVDSTELSKLPNITQLEGGRILKYMQEPNCGWTVVVGYSNNVFLKVLSRLLTSISRVDLYMADTLAKGVSFFKQKFPDIADQIPEAEHWKTQNLDAKTG